MNQSNRRSCLKKRVSDTIQSVNQLSTLTPIHIESIVSHMNKEIRLSVRVTAPLAAKIRTAAKRKKWSVQVWLEEAIIDSLAEEI